jgi:predicted alpha-1,2-mannosidase
MPERHHDSARPRTRHRLSALAAGALVALFPASLLVAAPAVAAESITPFDAVNQFIGTELDTSQNKSNDAYGNTYPGAALPFGMVQPSPTTYKVGETNDLVREKGGYEYTANQIRGFGMTRYSGTGCHTRFGGYEFPTIPFAGALADNGALPRNPSADHRSYFLDFSHADEVSEPGYYGVTTADKVSTELTATDRTAVSRFDFSDAEGSTLILDASGANNRTFEVEIDIDPATRTVTGSMYGADVCDNGNNYRAYFSTTYDQDFAGFGTWTNDAMTSGSTAAELTGDTGSDQRHKTGGWVTFADDAVVTAKTGFSYVSVESAAANAKAETSGQSFDDVRADARTEWEDALGTIEVEGGSDDEREKFYTAMYHSMLQPAIGQDVDGRYLGFDNQVHQIEPGRDFFRRINFAGQGWDMYRSQAQLIAMLFPQVANDINRSIVLLTQQTGKWSPGAARMSGDNYQVILSMLDAFGATDYDRQAALDSALKTQQLPATDSTRSAAFQYAATGMIESRKGDNATSRVLEYAIDDFAIAQLAERLGDQDAYDTMMVRAQNWMNVFDPETQQIRPRERNGFERDFDLRNRAGRTGDQFNQSTGLQYGWMVPHNVGTLVQMRGGVEKSTRELDSLMAQLDAGAYTQSGNYLSNEAPLTTPYVYNWLQAPHKATDVLYRAIDEMYDTTPSGLPGNDDEGALSAWYVFANIGIAPVIHGTANLVVTAPMFDRVTIRSADSDRVYDIVAPGVSSGAKYTTGLSVDGVAQTASWLDEDFAREGGTLSFTMSATPGTWGTDAADVPPSYTDGADAYNNIGTTNNGAAWMGSMDLSDWSFSRETLAAAGAAPGAKIAHQNGIEFTWPETAAGEPDNWIPHGQRVDMGGVTAGSISFLGLATNGPASGDAVVEYTDGSTQNVTVELADWSADPTAGGTTLVTVNGRNAGNGTTGGGTFRVFGTRPALLDVTKKVAAVTLPAGTGSGIMHIFDVATSAEEFIDPNAPTGEPERVILTATEDPSTSQYVTWRSRSQLRLDGTVEVRPVGGEATTVKAEQKPERSVDGYGSRSHSARLDNLAPGTEYEYRVASGSHWSDWFSFETAAAGAEPFTFLYFGDAQEGIDTVWPATVDAATAAHPEAEVGLYGGDLVNTATDENEWTNWFAGIEGLGDHTNSLVTMGNHEIGGQNRFENFSDSFEFDANGPVASDAGEYAGAWGAHLQKVLKDTVYYTDYQGVRFITLNANRDDIGTILADSGNTDIAAGKRAWMTAQATWLDRVLRENPNEWSVVLSHQPVFSTGVSGNGMRNEADWRQYILPVMERNNVDLVLQGHDHTYGRGYHQSTGTDMAGVTAGPVYVVANAGQKQYAPAPETDNVWTQNGGVPVKRAADTSTYQAITVDGDTLTYESVVTYTAEGGLATAKVGDTLDSFTITQRDNGAKWVTETGVAVPDETVEPVNAERPTSVPFDDETFGEVVFDDDFSTDKLAQYSSFGDTGEAAAQLSVDTEAGLLKATADGRRWSHLALPVDAGESFALVVEPESFTDTGASEDSLFIGLTDGPRNRAHSWFNNTKNLSGIDVIVDGAGRGLSQGVGERSVTWEPGDRLATVVDHGELSTWIEKSGEWQKIRSGLLPLTMTREQIETWDPTFSIRLDPGTISIDRVTLLKPSDEPVAVTPDAVTFADPEGSANDTYTIPAVTGVDYLVGDAVVAAGTYPGSGEVTVTARAQTGYAIPDAAQTVWSFGFTDVPPVDPEPTQSPSPTSSPTGSPSPEPTTSPSPEPTGSPSPEPTPGNGVPAAPAAESLTDANRGSLNLPETVVAGTTVVGTVDAKLAGQTGYSWMYSAPLALGSTTVNAVGELRIAIPAAAPTGEHRIALVLADGTFVGWDTVTVLAAGASLPATGGTITGIWWALGLLTAGLAVMFVIRRRRAA